MNTEALWESSCLGTGGGYKGKHSTDQVGRQQKVSQRSLWCHPEELAYLGGPAVIQETGVFECHMKEYGLHRVH